MNRAAYKARISEIEIESKNMTQEYENKVIELTYRFQIEQLICSEHWELEVAKYKKQVRTLLAELRELENSCGGCGDMSVSDRLALLRDQADSELAPLFYQLEDNWDRKLWHPVTLTLTELFADPRSASLRLPLYEQFISTFEDKINPLAAVSFAIFASKQIESVEKSLEFMLAVAAKWNDEKTREQHVFAELQAASIYVKQRQTAKAKKIIDNARQQVDLLPITDKVVLAQFYGVSCEYYKLQTDYTAYYRNALLYLACTEGSEVEESVQQQKAYDLCIAALLAPKIYNFGELVLHPILKSLGTEYKWLENLVLAVNEGDVPRFQQLRPEFVSRSPLLEASLPFLEQKICLMALCECVFRWQQLSGTNRTIPFASIAKETYLQAGAKVEVLVLKAFSLQLMRGKIDEVKKTVEIDWLQPRVLSREQVSSMRERLEKWDSNVKELGEFVKQQGTGVWQAV